MNNKILLYSLFLIYSLIGLLGSGVIGGVVLSNSEQAQSLPPSESPEQSRSIQADRHFIEMMIPHHQDAIVMADLALSRGRRPENKKLAAAIKQVQTSEIQEMRTWYKQWFGTEVPKHSMTDMGMMKDHHNQGQGMMMNMKMDIDALKTTKDFDKEFVRQMIPHHQMAVMMAQMASKRVAYAQIRTLTKSIIKSQNTEIAQMQEWQKAWN